MPRLLAITSLYVAAFTVYAAKPLETFLSTNPVSEATHAFNAGDSRHIVVPICLLQRSEAIPGWPTSGPTPPGLWAALEKGRRPFQCEDLGADPEAVKFMRLLNYAEQYNKTLLELEK